MCTCVSDRLLLSSYMGSHMPSSEDLSSIQFSGGRMLLGKELITDSLHIN